jgi:hypothetical protein
MKCPFLKFIAKRLFGCVIVSHNKDKEEVKKQKTITQQNKNQKNSFSFFVCVVSRGANRETQFQNEK